LRDAREALAEIAARAGVRTQPANMSVRGAWDTFERRCSFKSEGIRVDVYANPTLLSVWVHLPSPVQVADSDAAEALKAIDIEDGEQLEVHIDGASALLRSAGAEPDWNRLHRLIAFMRTLPAAATPEALDPLKVPADLRKLLPLVAKWETMPRGETSSMAQEQLH